MKIRQLRIDRGISRGALAESIGIGKVEVGRLERGERMPRNLEAVADALGCEPYELLGGTQRSARKLSPATEAIALFVESVSTRDPEFPAFALRVVRALVPRPKRSR